MSPSNSTILFLVSSALGSVSVTEASGQQTSLAHVTRVWDEREKLVHSASYVWSQRKIIMKGAFSSSPEANGQELPADDLSFATTDHRLYLEADKVSYHSVRLDLDLDTATLPDGPRRTRDTFDGQVAKTYTSARGAFNHEGIIHRDSKYPDLNNLNLFPVLASFRATRLTSLSVQRENLHLDEGPFDVDGVMCMRLRGRPLADQSGFFRSFWIDPARAFVVVRYAEYYDDQKGTPPRVWAQLDIGYQQDSLVQWVPMNWKVIFLTTASKVISSAEAQVVQYDLNRDVPEEEFALPFPVGTIVEDRNSRTTWVQGSGDKRLPVEMARSARAADTNNGWIVLVNVVVVLVLLTAVLRKRLINAWNAQVHSLSEFTKEE